MPVPARIMRVMKPIRIFFLISSLRDCPKFVQIIYSGFGASLISTGIVLVLPGTWKWKHLDWPKYFLSVVWRSKINFLL